MGLHSARRPRAARGAVADGGRGNSWPESGLLEPGWLLVALLVPLALNLGASQPFEPVKAGLLRTLVWAMAGLWLLEGLWQRERSVRWQLGARPVLWCVLALALVYGLATTRAAARGLALWGSYERAQGALTISAHLLLILILSSRLRTTAQARRLVGAMAATGLPLALLGLAQAAGRQPAPLLTDARAPVYATLGRANFLGAYLALLLPLTLAIGLRGYSDAGNALYAESNAKTAGVFKSNEGYGITVETNGSNHWDHAGYFTSNRGYGIYVVSEHNNGLRAQGGTDLSGVWQPGGPVGVAGLSGTGRGVFASSRESDGVFGISQERSGVYGETEQDDGSLGAGVWGQKWSGGGTAVRGLKYGDSGLAVYGSNEGSTGSGVSGTSANYNGVWGLTERPDNNYGFYTFDNLYSLNIHTSGAILQPVQNGGSMPLEPGDVVAFSGVVAPETMERPPLIQVAAVTEANSTAVAGVVYSGYDFEAVSQWQDTGPAPGSSGEIMREGPVAPGEYLLLVVQGPALVKVSAVAGAIDAGDLLASGAQAGYAAAAASAESSVGISLPAPGTVLGKALEPLDGEREMIYVYVTLQ